LNCATQESKKTQQCFEAAHQRHCILGMQELAFRGHDEGESSANKGNNNQLAEVIARCDALLAEHIELLIVFSGMSKIIPNDLIATIASSIKS
jgi:hypothetical protein